MSRAQNACLAFFACAAAAGPVRDPRWAVPLARPGLPNLSLVSSDLYRGGQPQSAGFAELPKLGIRTVVSLRAFHSEADTLRALGLGYERISFKVWRPEDEDVRRFLGIVTDPKRLPVFVHCKRGADRTGMMVAVYRICVQGWSRGDAIDEMTRGGFEFDPAWQDLVGWVRRFEPSRYEGCSAR